MVTLAGLTTLNVAGLRDRVASFVGAQGFVPRPEIRSIAVLPLEGLSRNPDEDHFAEGVTEGVITDLAEHGALRVISRQSVIHYKGTQKSVPEIAQELNVDAVVEGTVLRSGARVRITAQLIQVRPERHLWAETYERDAKDSLALQDEVASPIARKIETSLNPAK